MFNLRNISMGKKLIVVQLFTAFLSMLICGVVFIINEISVIKNFKVQNLSTTVQVIGTNTTGALLEGSRDEVHEVLSSVNGQTSILNAAVYDKMGNLFDLYSKPRQEEFNFPPSIHIEDDVLYDKNGKFFVKYDFSNISGGDFWEKLRNNRIAYSFGKKDLTVFYAVFSGKKFIGWVGLRSDILEVERAIQQYIIIVGAALLIGLLCAIFISSLLQKAISRPLSDLLQTIKNVSDTSDYSVEVLDEGHDELNALSNEFNKMIRIVRVRDHMITTAKDGLEKRVEERTKELKHAYLELEDKAKLLQKQNQELKEFTYVISHDLKSPLRAISSLSEWIEEDIKAMISGETARNLDLMRGGVARMQILIDALVEYASAEHITLEFEKVEVSTLVKDIIHHLKPPPAFSIQVQAGMPVLRTDRSKLGQIFSVLIRNAIRFHNKPNGNVVLTFKEKGAFYEFTVEDDGPGIAKEFHERIFVIFQTLHTRDRVETAGAGLAIAKKIVKHWGGDIWVESEMGKGSRFHFTWPKNYASDGKQR